MAEAWIHGEPVALNTAVAEAGRLLGASHLPVIAGLGTDVAGARAAVLLARRLRGVIDHMHADGLLRDIGVMRQAELMATTPNEARVRADVLLLVGPRLVAAWPDLPGRLFSPPSAKELGAPLERRVYWLCPDGGSELVSARCKLRTIGRRPAQLPELLAVLRARVAGRPVDQTEIAVGTLDGLAAQLSAARFGVAVWSAAELDALSLEMLCGLVDDLNAGTRFTGLPLAAGDNAVGVAQACGWMTGFPMRTGFGRGYPEHDPWRFDAARLVQSGEADCAMWVSAYGPMPPPWRRDVPTIALAGETPFQPAPRVQIAVGRPGQGHDGVEHSPLAGALAWKPAQRKGWRISVADAIGQIAGTLPAERT